MSMILTLLLVVQVLSALSIIILVLLQQGKGADMGSAFGGGSAGSLFGAAGAANFLSRSTKWAAVVFFVTTGALAYLGQGARTTAPEIGIMEGFVAPDPAIPQVPGDEAVPLVPDAAVPAAPTDTPAVPEAAVPSPADVAVPAPEAAASVPSLAEPAESPGAGNTNP